MSAALPGGRRHEARAARRGAPVPAVIAAVVLAVVLGACSSGGAGTRGGAASVPIVAAPTTAPPTSAGSPTSSGAAAPVAATVAATATSPSAPPAVVLGTIRLGLTKVADLPMAVALVVRPGDPDPSSLYVAQQSGTVRVIRGGALVDAPVLDLHERTDPGGERGLLGLAFSPDGARLYVSYTDTKGTSTIDEYVVGADGNADVSTRRTVITQEQPYANHNGGNIVFGPDGLLYFGLGDGGSANDPQRRADKLNTLLGKMLRIDPRQQPDAPYAVPADNPFVTMDGARPEIFSYGLRNPWRFSFDPANGDLWIGDVGQNEIEEVDHAVAANGNGRGANYGWSAYEGTKRFNDDVAADPNTVMPVHEYHHGDDGCSITGGFVYRGAAIPALRGAYLFSDYCSGGIRAIDPADPASAIRLVDAPKNVSSFGRDSAGELYVLSLDGAVYLIGPQ